MFYSDFLVQGGKKAGIGCGFELCHGIKIAVPDRLYKSFMFLVFAILK
jgi:hypothetical protein